MAVFCFLTSAMGIILNHPYQYAYVNAVGRFLNPVPLEAGMELDYWNVSLVDALKDAIAQQDSEKPLTCTALDPVTYLALEIYEEALPVPLQDRLERSQVNDTTADLIVVNLGYHEMYGQPLPENYTLLTETNSYGNALIRIYQRTE